MRGRIAWFLIGFLVSWVTWSTISNIRARTVDLTTTVPAKLRDEAPDWQKHARGRKVGRFIIFVPTDPSVASAWVYPSVGDPYLAVSFEDKNTDGRVDSMFVADSRHRTFSFTDDDSDGTFNDFDYSTGLGLEDTSFYDANMDGQFDLRTGPGRDVAVWIETDWRRLISSENKQYVDIDGERMEVRAVDGVWTIVASE